MGDRTYRDVMSFGRFATAHFDTGTPADGSVLELATSSLVVAGVAVAHGLREHHVAKRWVRHLGGRLQVRSS